jgi:hypothetical protein
MACEGSVAIHVMWDGEEGGVQNVVLYPNGTKRKPWCTSVLMHEMAVLSWPPPCVPVETNMPAYLPQKEP